MDTERHCPSCQKPLPPNAPKGLCPECLMKAGFGSGVAPEPGQPSRVPAFVPPSVADLGKLFPQFKILELLGQGGMGAVYKAQQPALDRLVALKILPPETGADTGFADRFTREARALARLSHPNIVAVHEFGQVGGLHYFVMEYVEGLNLRQLEQGGKLSPREALKIIPQICDALQFAHDEGIVHRDIKPENVMLDKKGRVKITDFGLAKILGREPTTVRLTGAKDVMGTPHYMAPEQIEHPQEVDHRADIYSLGVVFYEMLTGELPLGKFQAPSKKVQVDVRLDEVVLHALEKEPERRYQQASQVKTDVETIAATSPKAAPVPNATAQPGSQPGVEDMRRENPRFTADSVQSQFVILAVTWWLGLTLSIPSGFFPWLDVVCIPILVVSTVFWCILLYRHWSLLQGHGARTTPGKAVGYGFIPLFGFYWWFVAYAGLATDNNRYLAQTGITSKRMSFQLAVASCVLGILLCCVGWVPIVGAVLTIPYMIIGFILVVQQRDCVLAILRHIAEERAAGFGASQAGSSPPRATEPSETPITPAQPSGEGAALERAKRLVRWPAIGLITMSLLSPFILGVVVATGHLKAGSWMLFPLILELALVVVAALGGFKLLNLESRAMAMAGAIAGCVLSFFNFFCLPFAVWALAVASRRDVRAAFEKAHRLPLAGSPVPRRHGAAWPVAAVIAAAVMIVLAILAGVILLPVIVRHVSPEASRVSSYEGKRAFAVQQKLLREVVNHLEAADYRWDQLTVAIHYFVNPDIAECTIEGLRKRGNAAPNNESAAQLSDALAGELDIRHTGRGLWTVHGSGDLTHVSFTVDTSAEMAPPKKLVALLPKPFQYAEPEEPESVNSLARDVTTSRPAARSQFPKAAHIGQHNYSVMIYHDDLDLHYALLYAGEFNSSTRDSHNTRSKAWTDDGSLKLKSGRTFGYLRESPRPDHLRINGREYNLRGGRVFVLSDDGTVAQSALFPALAVARDPEQLAGLIATAAAPLPFIQAKPGEFKVTLANGVEFEVLAVASSPKHSTVWWRPDGSLLAEPPGDQFGTVSGLCPEGHSSTEFAVLVKGAENLLAEGDAVLTFNPQPQTMVRVDLSKNGVVQGKVAIIGFRTVPESLTCKVGLPDGPWERVATWDQAGTLLNNETGSALQLVRSGADNESCLKLRHEVDGSRFGLRLTARLKDGTYKTARICSGQFGSGHQALTSGIILGLSDSDVVAYELYRVPLRWAHIPGIATRPTVPPLEQREAAARSSGGTSQLEALSESERARVLDLFNQIEDLGHEWEAAFIAKSLAAAQTGAQRLLTLMTNFNAAVKGTGYEFPAGIFDDVAKVRQALEEGNWEKAQEAGRHNDQYAREFKRIGSRMIELGRERKGLPTGVFGPVLERMVAGEGDANKRFINLDTGRQFAAADFFGPKAEPSPEETQNWLREHGIDAVGDLREQYRGLVGFEMVAAPVASEEWDRLTPGGLDYHLAMSRSGTPVSMSVKGGLPATFVIKTREGAKGLLQVLGLTNDPPCVRIRYKLVQPARSNAATSPPTASARLLQPDPARRYWRWRTERPTPARLAYPVMAIQNRRHQ